MSDRKGQLALMCFEAAADLYHQRFGRLAPGKSEPAALGINSNDEANRSQYEKWVRSGQAFWDAACAAGVLESAVEDLRVVVEERDDTIEDLRARIEAPGKEAAIIWPIRAPTVSEDLALRERLAGAGAGGVA